MNIDAKITMLFSNNGLSIEIHDNNANVLFCKLELNQEQVLQAFSRISHVETQSCTVHCLEKIGKTHENKKFEFEIPERSKAAAIAAVDMALKNAGMEDWIPDNYYGSQFSFFTNGGRQFARTTIRRWI